MNHYFEIVVPLKEAHLMIDRVESEGWKVKDYIANGNGSRQIRMIVSIPIVDTNYFRLTFGEYMI